jgi:O-antigen ligase
MIVVVACLPRTWRLPLLVGCVLLGAGVLAAKGSSLSSFKRDKNVSEYHMAQSAHLRPMLAMVAMKIVWDHPLFGCGFGQYKKVDKHYTDDKNVTLPLEMAKSYVQHNVFLSLLAETGVVGCGLYVALLAGWLHRAWRVWRDDRRPLAERQHGVLFAAFTANWIINGLFHDTNLMMNVNLLAYFLAGVSQGLYARSRAAVDIALDPAGQISPSFGFTSGRESPSYGLG